MNPETQAVVESVRDAIAANARHPRGGLNHELSTTARLIGDGFLTIGLEERFGGSGGDLASALACVRAVGRTGRAIPAAELLHAAWLCQQTGTIPWPSGMVAIGRRGPDLTIHSTGAGSVVSGSLTRVPWGRYAHHVVVPVRHPGSGEEAVALIDVAGCESTDHHTLADEPSDDLHLSSAPAAIAVVSNILETSDLHAALLRAALTVGAMEEVLAMTLRYSGERHQFGKPLRRFQAVAHHLSTMAGHVLCASTAVDVAGRRQHGLDTSLDPFEVAAAKYMTSTAAREVAALSHQVHGAMGLTMEYDLHHYTKRLHSWAWTDGSSTHWASVAAHLLGETDRPLWDLVATGDVTSVRDGA